MSSRANLKFCLGDASRSKWSNMRPRAQLIMDQCLSAWKEKESILSLPERWADPVLPNDAHSVLKTVTTFGSSRDMSANEQLNVQPKKLTASDIWTASMNQQWFKLSDSLNQLLTAHDVSFQHIAFHIGCSLDEGSSCSEQSPWTPLGFGFVFGFGLG